MRPKKGDDISRPLRNSVIHTGHGDPWGKSWGSPSHIDPLYLKNPMDPPDILGLSAGAHNEINNGTVRFSDRKKRRSLSNLYFYYILIHMLSFYNALNRILSRTLAAF